MAVSVQTRGLRFFRPAPSRPWRGRTRQLRSTLAHANGNLNYGFDYTLFNFLFLGFAFLCFNSPRRRLQRDYIWFNISELVHRYSDSTWIPNLTRASVGPSEVVL